MRHDWSWKVVTEYFAVGLLVFGLTVGLAPVVRAIPIAEVNGTWQNDQPLGTATINNGVLITDTRTARWGIPVNPPDRSGYDWINATPFNAPTDGTPFSVGTFTHHNFPITGTAIASIDLNFHMEIDGTNLDGVFTFNHNETPNTFEPLSNPKNDDIVTITGALMNIPFTFEGTDYYFSILGFSQDGPPYVTNFVTAEGQPNSADLFGAITVVPEPATMLLLGSGLIGLAGFARRRFKK